MSSDTVNYVKLTEEEKDKAISALRSILFKNSEGEIRASFSEHVKLSQLCPILKRVFDEEKE